ncbi:MAG: phytanoyl-CoA dioxygenase family protein [Candidatus Latescibacterota bacterium]
MLSEEQVCRFHHDGFLNGGRALDEDSLAELQSELERVLQIGPDGFPPESPGPVLFRDIGPRDQGGVSPRPVWQIVNIWQASPAFERLIYHPLVVAAISQLTGSPDLMVWHDQVQYKPAGHGGTTTWHQDAPLWPIIRPMTPVSAWIPLDDTDEENGCMWMVPGSHRWGNQIEYLRTQAHLRQREEFGRLAGFTPPADAEVRTVEAVPWPVRQGEVSFHHSLTWHGSPANRSPRPRRAIAIHYMTGEARFVAAGQHVMKAYVHLRDGEPMACAGDVFPVVCRHGEPLLPPAERGARETGSETSAD